jgi:DNA ligase (NAD+)
METTPEVRMVELVNGLNSHDRAYYQDLAPEISDAEYDQLRRELIDLETAHPELVLPNSPSLHVGSSLPAGGKGGKFTVPMLSLGNVFNEEETIDFLNKTRESLEQPVVEFVVEPKLDGLALRCVYYKGKLATSNTRGTGWEGEDVTAQMRNVDNLPKYIKDIKVPDLFEIRGEAVVSLSVFHAINAELVADGKKPYSSPRNYAAGVLRRSNPEEVIDAGLSFVAYQIIHGEALESTHYGAMQYAKHWGFTINDMELVVDDSEVMTRITSIGEGRETSLFEWDGAVIKVNRFDQQILMGAGTKDLRWSTAYKFPAEEKYTKVTDIIIQVGRTGIVTPVAIVEPVVLAGAKVKRANLKNIAEVQSLGIGIGATVAIVRSGEVIPDISRVIGGVEKVFEFPTCCPACSVELERRGPRMYCVNDACKGQLLARMIYFTGRLCADIKGLGDKSLKVIIDAGLLKTYTDIYSWDVDDLKPLFGELTATKMLASIKGSMGMSLSKMLTGLGIPEIGPSTAKAIAEFFGSGEQLCEQWGTGDLDGYPGVGESAGGSFRDYFMEENNQILLYNLIYRGICTGVEEQAVAGGLLGKVFAITGSVDGYTKDSITRLVKQNGGTVSSSVNKKVDYLIVGETPGDKLAKAQKLSVPLLDKTSFESMLSMM